MEQVTATFLSQKPNKNAALIVAIVIACMAVTTALTWKYPDLERLWESSPQNVFNNHEYYRLPLSIFIHGDLGHFFSNMYMFGILGYLVCGYFGVSIFLFCTIALGVAVHALSLMTYEPTVTLIGISGVVYLLAGFWLVMFLGIDRRLSLGQRWLRAIGVGLIILFPTSFEPSTSYRAHFIGLVVGLIFGASYFYSRRRYFQSFEVIDLESSAL